MQQSNPLEAFKDDTQVLHPLKLENAQCYKITYFCAKKKLNQAFAHTDTNILVLFKKANISKIE